MTPIMIREFKEKYWTPETRIAVIFLDRPVGNRDNVVALNLYQGTEEIVPFKEIMAKTEPPKNTSWLYCQWLSLIENLGYQEPKWYLKSRPEFADRRQESPNTK